MKLQIILAMAATTLAAPIPLDEMGQITALGRRGRTAYGQPAIAYQQVQAQEQEAVMELHDANVRTAAIKHESQASYSSAEKSTEHVSGRSMEGMNGDDLERRGWTGSAGAAAARIQQQQNQLAAQQRQLSNRLAAMKSTAGSTYSKANSAAQRLWSRRSLEDIEELD